MLAFQLQNHPANVTIFGVRGEATQALFRIAPLHDLN